MIKMPNSLEDPPAPPMRPRTRGPVRRLADVVAVSAGLLAIIPLGLVTAFSVRSAASRAPAQGALAREVLEGSPD